MLHCKDRSSSVMVVINMLVVAFHALLPDEQSAVLMCNWHLSGLLTDLR